MRKELSIIASDEEIVVETNKSDVAVTLLKGLMGAAPFVGPMIAEVVSTVIPNQKLDRVITFIKVLEDKIKYIEESVLKEQIKSEEFTDLLEDGLNQASRALSNERREYIASLLKNSLSNDELTHVGEKKLLSILGELNDAEIIFLRFNSLPGNQKRGFALKHGKLLNRTKRAWRLPSDNDKEALRDSYENKLIQLGLLDARYQIPMKGQTPDYDEKTGTLKLRRLTISHLGSLLLRYIGLEQTNDKNANS